MAVNVNELSAAERIALAQDLWDSVVQEAESMPLNEEERRWATARAAYADRLDAQWSPWTPTLLALRNRR